MRRAAHLDRDRAKTWCVSVPVLLVTALIFTACGSDGGSASVPRHFFVNVGSNNAAYFTWTEGADGSIRGSNVSAARFPNGSTVIPSPVNFTGNVVGHHITFDFGPSVQGGEAILSGELGPGTLAITFPPSNGSCKLNPVVVFRSGSLAEFNRLVKHLSTVSTCLPS